MRTTNRSNAEELVTVSLAFASDVGRYAATGGYVLTLTIGGGAELAFHLDRAGLDRLIETARVATGTLPLKRPDVVN